MVEHSRECATDRKAEPSSARDNSVDASPASEASARHCRSADIDCLSSVTGISLSQAGGLLFREPDDGLGAGDVLHRNFDRIAVADRVEDQAVLDPQLFDCLSRQPYLDRVVAFIDAVDDPTQGLGRGLRRTVGPWATTISGSAPADSSAAIVADKARLGSSMAARATAVDFIMIAYSFSSLLRLPAQMTPGDLGHCEPALQEFGMLRRSPRSLIWPELSTSTFGFSGHGFTLLVGQLCVSFVASRHQR
jgi:hypothetical protein